MSLILDGTNGLSDVDGTAGTPAIRGSDANTGVFFGTDIVGVSTGGSERMRVNASGNVGIGTSSPDASMGPGLHIASASGNSLILQKSTGAAMQFRSDATTIRASISGINGADGVTFATGAAQTERARIDSSGNLLVGTTSALSSATISVKGPNNSNQQPLAIWNPGTSGTRYLVSFATDATYGERGYITSNGSTVTYATSSDYRLKENIAPMTGALQKVALLKPVTYTWKNTGETDEGFIAHELQEVCPSAVTGEKDAVNEDGSIKPQGIDTSFLVATLTAAIQELKAINDAQAQTIESLTARVTALEGA